MRKANLQPIPATIRPLLDTIPTGASERGIHTILNQILCPKWQKADKGQKQDPGWALTGQYYHALHYLANKSGTNEFSLTDELMQAIVRRIDTSPAVYSTADRARQKAEQLFAWYRIHCMEHPDTQVLGAEELINAAYVTGMDGLSITLPESLKDLPQGRIDRVEQNGKCVYARDYKTAYVESSSQKNATIANYRSGHGGMQLAWYQALVATRHGRCDGVILDIAWKESTPSFLQVVVDYRHTDYERRLQMLFESWATRNIGQPNYAACSVLHCRNCWTGADDAV